MRGLKLALVACAQPERVSVSVLVPRAVARELGLANAATDLAASAGVTSSSASAKLAIRMSPEEAEKLAAGARAAGLSRGASLSGLIANVPALFAVRAGSLVVAAGRSHRPGARRKWCWRRFGLRRGVRTVLQLPRQRGRESGADPRRARRCLHRRWHRAPADGRDREVVFREHFESRDRCCQHLAAIATFIISFDTSPALIGAARALDMAAPDK